MLLIRQAVLRNLSVLLLCWQLTPTRDEALMNTLLPRFSRSAERRVKDRLPAPEVCPHCRAAVRFVNNAEVYGQEYGEWPWMYLCQNRECRAYVGAHPHTNIPLGTLATPAIRSARKAAKDAFNPLWQTGQMTRREAYTWLAARLDIPVATCHFGWFDEAQCQKVLAALTEASAPPVKSPVAVKSLSDLRALLSAAAKR